MQPGDWTCAPWAGGWLVAFIIIFQYIQQVSDSTGTGWFPTQQEAILDKSGLVAIAKFSFAKHVSLPLPIYIGTPALNLSFARDIKPFPIGKDSRPSPLSALFNTATSILVDEFKLAIPQHSLDEYRGQNLKIFDFLVGIFAKTLAQLALAHG